MEEEGMDEGSKEGVRVTSSLFAIVFRTAPVEAKEYCASFTRPSVGDVITRDTPLRVYSIASIVICREGEEELLLTNRGREKEREKPERSESATMKAEVRHPTAKEEGGGVFL